MEWISIKDRLPIPNIPVLCWDDQNVKIAVMSDEKEYNEHWKFVYQEDKDELGCTGSVTHWMPLPKFPKE